MLIKNLIYFPPFLIIILANIIFKIFENLYFVTILILWNNCY